MNSDAAIPQLLLKLIEKLRDELHQYGEMLALLEQQQESVMARAADDVLNSVAAINEQMNNVQAARLERESCQNEIARNLRQPAQTGFAQLIPLLPEKFRVAIETLVHENNELLGRVQRRARQNHLLLSRSLQMMQQFMNTLIPANPPTTYNGEGNLQSTPKAAQLLYEGVG